MNVWIINSVKEKGSEGYVRESVYVCVCMLEWLKYYKYYPA